MKTTSINPLSFKSALAVTGLKEDERKKIESTLKEKNTHSTVTNFFEGDKDIAIFATGDRDVDTLNLLSATSQGGARLEDYKAGLYELQSKEVLSAKEILESILLHLFDFKELKRIILK